MPEEAVALLKGIQQANCSNFDKMLADPWSIPYDPSIQPITCRRKKQVSKGTCGYPSAMADHLEKHLLDDFASFYNTSLSPYSEFKSNFFFGTAQARSIVDSIDKVHVGEYHDTELIEKLWLENDQWPD